MSPAPVPDMVITKLSPLAICLRMMGVLALLFACWYLALHPGGVTAKDVFENRVWWAFALVLTPILLWTEWVNLRQMIFYRSRAVWIENGQLKYIDHSGLGRRFRLIQSLNASDIQQLSLSSVYLSSPWGYPSVGIKMKGGWYGAYILTLFFADSAKVVLARLSDALSLPKSS